MSFASLIFGRWEVPDRSSADGVYDAVVVMSVTPTKDGRVGSAIQPLLRLAANTVLACSGHLILANRLVVSGRNLCEEMVSEAVKLGISRLFILTPSNPRDPKIRNTWTEAEFAVSVTGGITTATKPPRLLVVANHLHIRRVLAAFRKIGNGRVELYWKSARGPGVYTREVYQERFYHPLFFLAYEVLALIYSKLKGWA